MIIMQLVTRVGCYSTVPNVLRVLKVVGAARGFPGSRSAEQVSVELLSPSELNSELDSDPTSTSSELLVAGPSSVFHC